MKTILVVEDEILIREELVKMLQKSGYGVIAIQDFSLTVEQILTIQPDIVILDLNIPGENGFSICENIKTKQSNLPILILTSREQLADEIKALQLGADEYLTKPFRKERLLARIENILKRYEGRSNLIEKIISY